MRHSPPILHMNPAPHLLAPVPQRVNTNMHQSPDITEEAEEKAPSDPGEELRRRLGDSLFSRSPRSFLIPSQCSYDH